MDPVGQGTLADGVQKSLFWNIVPRKMRSVPTLLAFQKGLKTWLSQLVGGPVGASFIGYSILRRSHLRPVCVGSFLTRFLLTFNAVFNVLIFYDCFMIL